MSQSRSPDSVGRPLDDDTINTEDAARTVHALAPGHSAHTAIEMNAYDDKEDKDEGRDDLASTPRLRMNAAGRPLDENKDTEYSIGRETFERHIRMHSS